MDKMKVRNIPQEVLTKQSSGDLNAAPKQALTDAFKKRQVTPESKIAHGQAYEARIEVLRGYASEDDDIEKVNEDSIDDFWAFMKIAEFSRRAGLVLLDSGDLRAVWRESDGHDIGLRFIGNQKVLYVIFKHDADRQITERAVGADSFDIAIKQIKDLDLLHFVKE